MDFSFLMPKISAKQTVSPATEAPNAGEVLVKIGDFRQITGYNSKTLTVASVVNFVYHTERPPLFALLQHVCRDAVRRAGLSATTNTC